MNAEPSTGYIAFDGDVRIASGDLRTVALACRQALDRKKDAAILIFDSQTSAPVEIDLRGSAETVLALLPKASASASGIEDTEPSAPRGPGRPRLGVVAREVTLLPRHWDWLAQQKGGASVAIRKLVEDARRGSEDKDRIRAGQEAAYRFMSAVAGDKPHFEDAIRALFADDRTRFEQIIAEWPIDVRDHAAQLAESAFHYAPPMSPG